MTTTQDWRAEVVAMVRDPEWRSQAEALIAAFVAPTKRDRYLSKPELLSENIAHDLERHLDSRRAIAIGGEVHSSGDLVSVLRGAMGSLQGGYCVVAGPYCPHLTLLAWVVPRICVKVLNIS